MFGVQSWKMLILVNAFISLSHTAVVQTGIFLFQGFNMKRFLCI